MGEEAAPPPPPHFNILASRSPNGRSRTGSTYTSTRRVLQKQTGVT